MAPKENAWLNSWIPLHNVTLSCANRVSNLPPPNSSCRNCWWLCGLMSSLGAPGDDPKGGKTTFRNGRFSGVYVSFGGMISCAKLCDPNEHMHLRIDVHIGTWHTCLNQTAAWIGCLTLHLHRQANPKELGIVWKCWYYHQMVSLMKK